MKGKTDLDAVSQKCDIPSQYIVITLLLRDTYKIIYLRKRIKNLNGILKDCIISIERAVSCGDHCDGTTNSSLKIIVYQVSIANDLSVTEFQPFPENVTSLLLPVY